MYVGNVRKTHVWYTGHVGNLIFGVVFVVCIIVVSIYAMEAALRVQKLFNFIMVALGDKWEIAYLILKFQFIVSAHTSNYILGITTRQQSLDNL